MKTRLRKTLLQCLMIDRHLTREQVIELLDRRARDMGVRDFALSLRQLDRWLAGDVVTLPRASLCRVVEAEFRYPVRQLLAVGDPLGETASPPQAEAPSAQSTVSSGEVESVLDVMARMGWLGSVNTEGGTLEVLHAAAQDIIARYGAEGPSRLAPEVVRLRRHVHELLQGHQHPRQRLRLYALAGRLSAMLGYMAVNQARFMLAQAYCAEAFALAAAAEDADLQAWVRAPKASPPITRSATRKPWSWPATVSVTLTMGPRRSGWRSTVRPGHWGGWETAAASTRRSSAPTRESLGYRLGRV
jgi:hypothetical protein